MQTQPQESPEKNAPVKEPKRGPAERDPASREPEKKAPADPDHEKGEAQFLVDAAQGEIDATPQGP